MALVTGTLVDVGLDTLHAHMPELIFTPSSATTTITGQVVSGKPVTVIPAADGSWSVELVASELTQPPISYSLKIRLLSLADPNLPPTWMDFPDWRIFVPVEGGPLPNFADVPTAGGIVWEVAGDTIPPFARRGDLMLNTLTSDLYRIG